MPQIAQQDYKVIAPKEGRAVVVDAAALAELKKAILAGIGFDCIVETAKDEGVSCLGRIEGLYADASCFAFLDMFNSELSVFGLEYTVTQYQGLAAVQEAIDETLGVMNAFPAFSTDDSYLIEDGERVLVCVDGKFLTVTGSATIEALTIAETGPTENFVNITWEDAQKLIGLPLV